MYFSLNNNKKIYTFLSLIYEIKLNFQYKKSYIEKSFKEMFYVLLNNLD